MSVAGSLESMWVNEKKFWEGQVFGKEQSITFLHDVDPYNICNKDISWMCLCEF